jgi:hypothetical protein
MRRETYLLAFEDVLKTQRNQFDRPLKSPKGTLSTLSAPKGTLSTLSAVPTGSPHSSLASCALPLDLCMRSSSLLEHGESPVLETSIEAG